MRSKILAVLVASALLSGCGDPSACANEVRDSTPSPNGALKAVMFNRNCGATTGVNTQVAIIGAREELPNEAGNVLIVDDTVPIVVQWQSDSKITISGDLTTRIFERKAEARGVHVEYMPHTR